MGASLTLQICKTVIGLVGTLGNGLVIAVICRVQFMHTLTNVFIGHQAAIDLVASLLLLLQTNIPAPDTIPHTLAGELLCRLWVGDALQWVLFTTSTYSLLAVTMERYIAIVYPFRHTAVFSKKSTVAILGFVWLICVGLKSYSFIIYSVEDGKCNLRFLPSSKFMGPLIIVLQYFVPSTIMLFSYTHIAVTLKRSAEQVAPLTLRRRPEDTAGPGQQQQQPRVGNEQQESLLRARRNTVKTLIFVFATFLVCWTPSQCLFFMFNMGWISIDFDGALNVFTVLMVASNCCINPIIYSFKYKQFRKALNKMIGRQTVRQDDWPGPSNAHSDRTTRPT